ncbi:hypothetical protein C9I57_31830 [Trinickia symbiotica]|uniref:Uncharacterized protein n=1 Tax=Trinickia symbiotica TaxID=863227 RepID=A0A2T3XJQ2_9BURK|nr:hypothetical protein [Trinickia symbiotica]PTB16750.1 hypothetical protein C9I57_31830 [Trinickia symbiotica]
MDSQARQQLGAELAQMAQAAQASGNTQAYQQFVQSLQTAQGIIQGMAGQSITSNGSPIVADDGLLKTFQATGSQFNDSSLFGTPGGTSLGLAMGETPASVGIAPDYYIAPNGPTNQQVNGFANDILQQVGTPNGSVTPVYPAESVLLGSMVGGLVSGALGEFLGPAEGTAQTVTTSGPSAASAATSTRSVESLFGQSFDGPLLSHTAGIQDGTLGESLGLKTLDGQTGMTFKPLQNNSGNGADGVAIDSNTKTIWVAEVKSSQNGVGAAATAQGDPATKLETWVANSQSNSGSWAAQPSGNAALAKDLQKAIDSGYQIKGVQVQVGVPAPGATGATQISIQPWLPK